MTGNVGTRCFTLLGLLLSCLQSFGQVELPELNYEQDALEPYISAEVRKLANNALSLSLSHPRQRKTPPSGHR